ncbi:unnamed protein product [Spirodela intermedia]|uniref:Transcription initiation factor TFIID subunit 1 n=1 Tax=Spirodela intermedia TaxID=51605 RepID=A0A7I8K4E9_SPIIN|nr:unnamed protein product [Spirodela intermedia]
MFGNVDASGYVDADYLDEDAKESLSALADKLGSSLADLGLVGSPLAAAEGLDDGEEDAGFACSGDDEDDELPGLSPNQGFSVLDTSVDLSATQPPLFDEEDYDADAETAKGSQVAENQPESHALLGSRGGCLISVEPLEDDECVASDVEDPLEHPVAALESSESKEGVDLPVLCIEGGKEILRFSEIFGVHEPSMTMGRWFLPWNPSIKAKFGNLGGTDTVEDDEEDFLKTAFHVPVIGRDLSLEKEDHVDKQGGDEDSCLPGQPMKEEAVVDEAARWWEDGGPGFYLVDQRNWEDEIVWESPPSTSHGYGSCVISEHETDAEAGEMANSQHLVQGFRMKPEEDHHLVSCADSKEVPLILREDCGPTELQASEEMRIGQETAEVKTMKGVEKLAEWHTRKLSLQNMDFLDGSWLDQIVWDPTDHIPKPKLVLLPQFLGHSDRRGLPTDRFNLSNDEFYSDLTVGLQPRSRPKRRADYLPKVIHSIPALKLQTMKPRLTTREIAHFHRPKSTWYPHENEYASKLQGALCTQGPIKIMLKALGGKHIKLHMDAGGAALFIKSKIAKKLDFKLTEKVKILYRGKELEDEKPLAHQDVRPNSLLHIIRSKLHLWPSVGFLPGSSEYSCPLRAFIRKSDLSLRDGRALLMEYSEERPLLLGNIGMGARICAYYRKPKHGDQAPSPPRNGNDGLGDVITLDPADESPFLGDISPGSSQLSLETNMYRAPLFLHKSSSTDYLLVRSAKGMLSLRRISKLYVVGQQEPHVEVSSPGMASVRNYNSKRLLVYVYREFCAKEQFRLCPWIRADEVSLQFPSLSEGLLRKRLKHCADFLRRPNGACFWVKKPDFRVPSEGEIRRILSPEDVCSYESMQAGLHSLKRMGISELRRPISLPSRLHQLSQDPPALAAASYIQWELLMTPWNLSARFVSWVNQGLKNRKAPAFRAGLRASVDEADLENLSVGGTSDLLPMLGFCYCQIMMRTRYDQCSMVRPPHLDQRKCLEIWDRGIRSLSHPAVEGDPDLDSFAMDLEDLLVAEESRKGKRRFFDLGDDEPREAEDEEDEASEASLMSIRLDDDDDIKMKIKEKTRGRVKGVPHSLKRAPFSEKNGDMFAGLFDGKKESISVQRRPIFACGACGQMGHMKTNKNCPKHRDESGTSESENASARSLVESGMRPPLQASTRKLMRVEISERDEGSGMNAPGSGALRLKFKCIRGDLDREEVEETDAHPSPNGDRIAEISGHTKSGDNQEESQISSLVLRLPARRKIILKPPKLVSNVEAGEAEADNNFIDAGTSAERGGLVEDIKKHSKQPRRFLRQEKISKNISEDRLLWTTTCERKNPREGERKAKSGSLGEVMLSTILETIVDDLRKHHEISYLFVRPVSRREAPDYLDIIQNPIDLSTIKEKARRMEYRNRDEFRRDVWLINFNAHRYNDGRNPGVPPLADELLRICDRLLDQYSGSLAEAEDGIEFLRA